MGLWLSWNISRVEPNNIGGTQVPPINLNDDAEALNFNEGGVLSQEQRNQLISGLTSGRKR